MSKQVLGDYKKMKTMMAIAFSPTRRGGNTITTATQSYGVANGAARASAMPDIMQTLEMETTDDLCHSM